MSPGRALRTAALALALVVTPACASMRVADPIAAAQTSDQKAYALISAYAIVLQEATALIANPATPAAVRAALVKAEVAATPAVELVKIAGVAAREASEADRSARETALARAVAAAAAPVAALSQLIKR